MGCNGALKIVFQVINTNLVINPYISLSDVTKKD